MASPTDQARLVRGLQERVARALPADYVERIDGWWLRRAATSSWWMATVLPHGDETPLDLGQRISAAEEFYRRAELPIRFQICPGACPPGIDSALAARGYRWESPMSLRTAAAATVHTSVGSVSSTIRIDDAPSTEWFDAWYAVHGEGNDPDIERSMLARVRQPSAYASVLDGAEVVAVGRAVAEDGWAGLFGMATLPAARGRGAGQAILGALAQWAVEHHAPRLYLQVERENESAGRLYDKAGFTVLRDYHYRRLSTE